jgi:predicted alpha-1,2-mannosidase
MSGTSETIAGRRSSEGAVVKEHYLNRLSCCWSGFKAIILSLCAGGIVFGATTSIASAAGIDQSHNARYVDPFFGSAGGGHVFPGATLPFGMLKAGPDMGMNTSNSGWTEDGDINGFSQVHVSGTGGGPKYGNILVQPTVGAVQPADHSSPRVGETAKAGYYETFLQRYQTNVEIAATQRAAIYRFTYGQHGSANLLFDLAHCLTSAKPGREAQQVVATDVRILTPSEVSGWTRVIGGWNRQKTPYTVYFYAVSDTPAEKSGVWSNNGVIPEGRQAGGEQVHAGAWLTFGDLKSTRQVRLKIGISFVSEEQAKKNALGIPGFDFDRIRAVATKAWDRALATLDVPGASTEEKRLLYTAMYHTMLMPVDRTGENPLWTSTEPYYDDFYAIWDIFRTSGPLLTLVAPKRESEIIRSLVNIYEHEGWLPDARNGNYNGLTQGGSNAEFMITDGFVKHLHGIDWEKAYLAEKKDAEIYPPDQLQEGRGGLADYNSLGYVTIEGVDRPGSKQMEYAADDFEIGILAQGIGHSDDAAKYFRHSANWQALWDAQYEDSEFKGFIRPRHRDGSWKANFTALQSCSWEGDTFYEGNSWTYSLFVPQDVATLITKVGGKSEFVRRVDSFFDVPGRYDVGDEPGFLTPYLYIWAGRPDKTDERIRSILSANFLPGRDGLPGNDDSGAMSSWYLFGVIGLFPNAGQDVYLIGSPALREAVFHLPGGKDFIIEAPETSPANKYVVSAKLNGHPYNKAWLRHEDIAAGGKLELTMGDAPSHWAVDAPPPSFSDQANVPLTR